MTQHTPGPWIEKGLSVYAGVDEVHAFGVKGKNLLKVAETDLLEDVGYSEVRANALLIAAAPDLLEACKRALELKPQYAESFIRAAIAKATSTDTEAETP